MSSRIPPMPREVGVSSISATYRNGRGSHDELQEPLAGTPDYYGAPRGDFVHEQEIPEPPKDDLPLDMDKLAGQLKADRLTDIAAIGSRLTFGEVKELVEELNLIAKTLGNDLTIDPDTLWDWFVRRLRGDIKKPDKSDKSED